MSAGVAGGVGSLRHIDLATSAGTADVGRCAWAEEVNQEDILGEEESNDVKERKRRSGEGTKYWRLTGGRV